jgi:endonuclease I
MLGLKQFALLFSLATLGLSARIVARNSQNATATATPGFGYIGKDVYWDGVSMKDAGAVQARLKRGSKKLSYGALWDVYASVWTGLTLECTGMTEVYSGKCWTPRVDQCQQIGAEGKCYIREHSWPKSWWGGSTAPKAYTDVFGVLPADSHVNGKRSNHPYGEVPDPNYVSSEGNKRGFCAPNLGYYGTCFEPVDRVKGFVARGHLFYSVRYIDEFSCCSLPQVDEHVMEPWYKTLIKKWHKEFPPQAWEREFNDRAYTWQGNRNPFIDFPELVDALV